MKNQDPSPSTTPDLLPQGTPAGTAQQGQSTNQGRTAHREEKPSQGQSSDQGLSSNQGPLDQNRRGYGGSAGEIRTEEQQDQEGFEEDKSRR